MCVCGPKIKRHTLPEATAPIVLVRLAAEEYRTDFCRKNSIVWELHSFVTPWVTLSSSFSWHVDFYISDPRSHRDCYVTRSYPREGTCSFSREAKYARCRDDHDWHSQFVCEAPITNHALGELQTSVPTFPRKYRVR